MFFELSDEDEDDVDDDGVGIGEGKKMLELMEFVK